MTLLKDREKAWMELEKNVKTLLETPLDFRVGSYNGLYHGNKISMDYSKLLKKRKAHVEKSTKSIKKIEKLCCSSMKSKTKFENLVNKSIIDIYEKLRPKTQETINYLSRECIGGFKVW